MATILLLGGTAWLGRTLAEQAVAQGHAVTCLARGESGGFPAGVRPVTADRTLPDAYHGLAGHHWDLVVELTRFPAAARAAVEQLSAAAQNWAFVSSCSVYADQSVPGAVEDTTLLPPLEASSEYAPQRYGEAKSGCEWLTVASRGATVLLVAGPDRRPRGSDPPEHLLAVAGRRPPDPLCCFPGIPECPIRST